MTEEEFLERWNIERPIYEKWGEHVAHCLIETLQPLIAPISTELFVKFPIIPRLKTGGSFITKAFYNTKKAYQNPYDEITDKVGVRIVVLLPSQISKVETAVEQCGVWDFSKDRDFETEITENPSVFDYQSMHYVVRNKAALEIDGVLIPPGIPCEVQIRNLLQHAHSELTHDTIYKPSVEKTPPMMRAVSKAMALIEATGDYFEDVAKLIEELISQTRRLTEQLCYLYQEKVGASAEPTKTDILLMEAFGSDDPEFFASVRAFVESKPYIGEKIAARAKTKILFRQPSILLVYKAASEKPHDAKSTWPLTQKELEPIFSDLGIALNS
ncbi:MAG: RelA/SpoT domain-containing protein [Afipia felis]|nr:RelA/SpoT domain-containing protein [Afipia felis]